MSPKKPWQSKTLWINLVLALSAFVPDVQSYLVAQPEVLVLGFAAINMVLRLVSKDAIQITE